MTVSNQFIRFGQVRPLYYLRENGSRLDPLNGDSQTVLLKFLRDMEAQNRIARTFFHEGKDYMVLDGEGDTDGWDFKQAFDAFLAHPVGKTIDMFSRQQALQYVPKALGQKPFIFRIQGHHDRATYTLQDTLPTKRERLKQWFARQFH